MPEYLTVSQAAARLGVSERTIQRRCKAGKLLAQLVTTGDGQEWQIEAATLPPGADTLDSVTPKVPTSADAVSSAAQDQEYSAAVGSVVSVPTGDARSADSEVLALLRSENVFLRGLIEQRDRDAAELRAALRKALEAMPKAITAGTPNVSRESEPPDVTTPREKAPEVEIPATEKKVAQRGRKREKRPLQRVLARLIGLRIEGME